MAKTKKCDTLALTKSDQKSVVKKTKQIKQKLKTGEIKLRSRFRPKRFNPANRGLVYVGHIPHGFYEDEMRAYFKQFGRVTNVIVCRSKKTGNSKGYGYVEFAHPEVAKIAAETMDNYLMFKKRIVAQFVSAEKRPPHIFEGKRTTLNRIPTKIRREKEIQHKNRSIDDETHLVGVKEKLNRISKKLEKLQKLGIDCNLSSLKSAKSTVGIEDGQKLHSPKLKKEEKVKKEGKITKTLKNKLKMTKKEQDDNMQLLTPKKAKNSPKNAAKEPKSATKAKKSNATPEKSVVKAEGKKKEGKIKAGVKKAKENAIETISKIKKTGGIVKSKLKKTTTVLDGKKLQN